LWKLVAPLVGGATLLVTTTLTVHAQAPGWPYAPVGPGCASPYPGAPYSCPRPALPAPTSPAAPPSAAPATPPSTPPAPGREPAPTPPTPTPPAPTPSPEANQAANEALNQAPQSGAFGTGGAAVGETANFKGDFLGLPVRLGATGQAITGVQSGGRPFQTPVAAIVTRTFKVSEDENPRPQDRVYVDFNYYDNVSKDFNSRFQTGLNNIQVYRETFGVEKTLLDGDASVGLRLPLNSAHVSSDFDFNGSNTDIGDLTVIGKYVPWCDSETGNLVSVGLAVTAPTGPDHFANSAAFPAIHETILTPFVGGVWRLDKFYTQVFLSIDVPTREQDVTIWHTDIQLGYFLMTQHDCDALLRAVIPVFEVHVSDPLNHRGVFDLTDLAGTDDVVDLTAGVHLELRGGSSLGLAVATPVTGPKPFDVEAIVQFDYRFGCSRTGAGPYTTPGGFGD
jgi:hypothetical protein